MGRLSAGQWFEIAFWLAFAGLALGVSFQFDREIEMYRFGAAGWPRVVIGLVVMCAIGQFIHAIRASRSGVAAKVADEAPDLIRSVSEHGAGYVVRVGITLSLPMAYAGLLQYTGYYFTTPVFIAAYLYVTGERRVKWLVFVPLLIYSVLTVLFTRFLYVGLPVGYWPGFYDFSNWLIVLIRPS